MTSPKPFVALAPRTVQELCLTSYPTPPSRDASGGSDGSAIICPSADLMFSLRALYKYR